MRFKKEHRYHVIKRKNLTEEQEIALVQFLAANNIATVESVVIESDWDCYPDAWDMVEREASNVE